MRIYMENVKYVKKLIEQSASYEISKFKDNKIQDSHVPYEGSPKKHPTDDNILILLTDPFSRRSSFYEFSIESIGSIEELGTISSEDGSNAYMIRVWIRKGMTALKTEPFIVD